MRKTYSYQSPDRSSCIDYETPSENDEEESPNRKSSSAAGVGSRKNDSPKSPASTISINSSIDYQTQSDEEEPETSPIRKHKEKQSPTHKSPPSGCTSQDFPSIPPKSSISNSLASPSFSSNRKSKEDRLRFTRLMIRCQEIKNIYALSRSSLKFWLSKADNLAHDNAELQLINADLKNRLVSSIINDFRSPCIRDNGGTSGGPNNRVAPSREADPVTSPTSVIGNINQGFEENSVQFQPERASLPKSISVRSSSYFKMNAGRNTTAPPFNRITGRHRADATRFVPRSMNAGTNTTAPSSNRLRAAATPFYPRTSLRVHIPTLSAVDEKKVPVELDACVQGMYKTELCNKWVQAGVCRYGDRCQFAHGFGELRPVVRHPRYKTEVCRGVLNGGFCPYGHRCHFRHVLTDQEKRAGITHS
ncbi:hypothetical protein MKX03_002005 [Papaver bracteatum]|nr:hypothetical protein MKX03_002005 [Papaver bracteatum]